MLKYLAQKTIGTRNDRELKTYRPLIQRVNDLEKNYKDLSDDKLRAQTVSFRERIDNGESLDSIMPEAFSVVREASIRTLGMRHFDVQLMGGMILHQGKIAEMRTGEGKTLVATLPSYLNGLSGKGVHVVTVNDYLARRDAEWMGQVHDFLGLSVGVIYSRMPSAEKQAAYQADITYGQNNEFGFDYLRDNMKFSVDNLAQRPLNFAIVDEVDSILIDEARTPLIISGPAEDSSEVYYTANKIVPSLKDGEHYEIDLKVKHPELNEAGIAASEKLLKVDNLYDPQNIGLLHHVKQALKAHTCMERDTDYIVKDGEIIIVDEFTGRLMPGRRWSDGLHQAIEAKEGLKVARENQTLASITFQNLFRIYDKLSGMTGTAVTEAEEFRDIYSLDVIVVPTNKPMIRDDQSDMVLRTREEKYETVADDIIELNKAGQPVLVGTISIEQSEALSKTLQKKRIAHNVLNAKQHSREAEIVAQAGRLNGVTIATNMAGRGTDILLGGNPEFLARDEVKTEDYESPEYLEVLEKYKEICAEEKKKVLELGGLFIMGTERHESRRIDNQLRGRAGRQGDPGVSRFYVALEDDLMKRFGGEKMQGLMTKMGWQEGMVIDGRLISRSIEKAQKKVERFHFDNRKHVTEYDDVMNKQRQVVYDLRNKILRNDEIREEVFTAVEDLLEDSVLTACDEQQKAKNWDLDKIAERFKFFTNADCPDLTTVTRSPQMMFDLVRKEARLAYERLVAEQQEMLDALRDKYMKDGSFQIALTEESDQAFDFEFSSHEQSTMLADLDHYWNRHLQAMDNLRDVIGLRSYGQKNPKHEYQREGFILFTEMLERFKETTVRKLFYSDLSELKDVLKQIEAEQKRRAEIQKQMEMTHPDVDGTAETGDESEGYQPKDPDEQRAKRQAARKAQRKQKKKGKK